MSAGESMQEFISKSVRVPIAGILSVLATAYHGLKILIMHIPYELRKRFVGVRSPLEDSLRRWSSNITHIVQFLLWMDIRAPRPDFDFLGKPVLVLSNHPPFMGVPLLIWYVAKFINSRATIISKQKNVLNILISVIAILPGIVIGVVQVIRYKRPKQAKKKIREFITRVIEEGRAYVILEDQHRPLPSALAADQKKFSGKVRDLEMLTHVGVARANGSFEALEASSWTLPVVELTCGFGANANGWFGPWRVFDGSFHIVVRQIPLSEIPRKIEEYRLWTNARQQQRQRLIKGWQSGRRRHKKSQAS